MGILRRIADALFMTAAVEAGPKFADGNVIDWDAIPPQFFGISQAPEGVAPLLRRVPRRWAMAVPGVKRGRDLICTPIGGLPLRTYNAARQDVTGELMMQPEVDVPRVITFTRTVEDLLFEGRAWWRITETYGPAPYDFPKHVRRLKPRHVDCSKPGEVWVTDDVTGKVELVDSRELIRFDSPTDGILWAGAGAISTVLMLDKRAYRSAENPTPDGYFTPYDGQDPFDEEDDTLTDEEQAALYTAKSFLAEWQQSRLLGTQGYVPGGVKYEQLQWDPKAMQLAEARQHAVLEIARLMGLEPEDLGVPVTSRTYFNAETKRRDRIDFTLGMFMDAIQDRLSMGDVTPRGQYSRFDVDHFLRTDTMARLQAYQLGQQLGLYDLAYMQQREDLPPLAEPAAAPTQEVPAVDNVRQLPTGQAASSRPAATFSSDLLVMSAPAVDQAFRVDVAKRQITGTVVPYGGAQAHSKGQVYQFAEGTIAIPADVSRVKFYVNHDENQAIGHAIALTDGPDRLVGTFQLDSSPEADRALQKANDKVWDGLSGGFRQGGQFKAQDGVQFAVSAPLGEVSLCPSPAFDDARVSAVALSADTGGNTPMRCTKCGQVHAHGVTACDPAALAAFTAANAQQFTQQQLANPQAQAGGTTQVAGTQAAGGQGGQSAEPIQLSAVTEAIQQGFNTLVPQLVGALTSPQREIVQANGQGGQQFQVREELPYRFNGSTAGEHCFTDDLRDSQSGNHEAAERLHRFMAEAFMPAPDPKTGPAFAVTTGNVAAFNPTQNRPDLYVPNLQYTRPLFDAVSTGTIENQSPFNIPKFATATGLVGPHTQGVEPTPGAFTATVQTVTPSPVSGKVEINREVWDLGGNPQTDTIVWNEMQNAYFEGIETNIATMLNALAAATLYTGAEINLAGAVDAALNTALTNLLVDLQFVRGGNRYSAAVADGMLYKALATAKDGNGRPLFPLLGPANANGQLSSQGSPASSINVAGQVFNPAWALNTGVANAYNSYLFVPSSVWAWASPPKRFTFEYQVKSIDMAVWGYVGSAVLRNSDVARIDYTTADV